MVGEEETGTHSRGRRRGRAAGSSQLCAGVGTVTVSLLLLRSLSWAISLGGTVHGAEPAVSGSGAPLTVRTGVQGLQDEAKGREESTEAGHGGKRALVGVAITQ